MHSVLVTACTSNGPMLSHTPPRYRKSEIIVNSETSIKEELLHNGEKVIKIVILISFCYQISFEICVIVKSKKNTLLILRFIELLSCSGFIQYFKLI